MVPFKNMSSIKHYIRNKPHKWVIKLWARAGSEGILHDFDVYKGSTSTHGSEHGVSGYIVMNMTKKLEGKGYKVYADNLFSSL
ncbi:PiggyBac transposable element-derived protein 4 [Plakobranchus ocellatus]|uniref:PiggyBac transposable element-derived protein 4 n=1 Tax=Plakobranchus ocellatus TaxID=259542 RepID=A0AAV3YJE5_9GAST|nr:PiggyBac transposable element-derived protein 4 [Plakobranchus ocellatus]